MVRSFVLSSLSLLFLSFQVTCSPVVSGSTLIPACPAANGFQYQTPFGKYVVQCSISYQGFDLSGDGKVAQNFQTCLDQCASNSACKAVAYETGSRKCYLKSKVGTSKVDSGVIGAALLSGPPAVPLPAAATVSVRK
jgi:hypothetical protein